MKIKKSFNARGLVYGKYWGGGRGSYEAVELKGFDTKEELIKEAEKKLKDGSLDSGMGYETLLAAALIIDEVKKVDIEGEDYINHSEETQIIGIEKLMFVEIEFLETKLFEWFLD